jgi:hypothetical protein
LWVTSQYILPFYSIEEMSEINKEGKAMGKYLILWEVDQTKIPVDAKNSFPGVD